MAAVAAGCFRSYSLKAGSLWSYHEVAAEADTAAVVVGKQVVDSRKLVEVEDNWHRDSHMKEAACIAADYYIGWRDDGKI